MISCLTPTGQVGLPGTKTSKSNILFLAFDFQGDGGAREQYQKFAIKAFCLPLPATCVILLGFLGSCVTDIAAFSFSKEATLITAKEDVPYIMALSNFCAIVSIN